MQALEELVSFHSYTYTFIYYYYLLILSLSLSLPLSHLIYIYLVLFPQWRRTELVVIQCGPTIPVTAEIYPRNIIDLFHAHAPDEEDKKKKKKRKHNWQEQEGDGFGDDDDDDISSSSSSYSSSDSYSSLNSTGSSLSVINETEKTFITETKHSSHHHHHHSGHSLSSPSKSHSDHRHRLTRSDSSTFLSAEEVSQLPETRRLARQFMLLPFVQKRLQSALPVDALNPNSRTPPSVVAARSIVPSSSSSSSSSSPHLGMSRSRNNFSSIRIRPPILASRSGASLQKNMSSVVILPGSSLNTSATVSSFAPTPSHPPNTLSRAPAMTELTTLASSSSSYSSSSSSSSSSVSSPAMNSADQTNPSTPNPSRQLLRPSYSTLRLASALTHADTRPQTILGSGGLLTPPPAASSSLSLSPTHLLRPKQTSSSTSVLNSVPSLQTYPSLVPYYIRTRILNDKLHELRLQYLRRVYPNLFRFHFNLNSPTEDDADPLNDTVFGTFQNGSFKPEFPPQQSSSRQFEPIPPFFLFTEIKAQMPEMIIEGMKRALASHFDSRN